MGDVGTNNAAGETCSRDRDDDVVSEDDVLGMEFTNAAVDFSAWTHRVMARRQWYSMLLAICTGMA